MKIKWVPQILTNDKRDYAGYKCVVCGGSAINHGALTWKGKVCQRCLDVEINEIGAGIKYQEYLALDVKFGKSVWGCWNITAEWHEIIKLHVYYAGLHYKCADREDLDEKLPLGADCIYSGPALPWLVKHNCFWWIGIRLNGSSADALDLHLEKLHDENELVSTK